MQKHYVIFLLYIHQVFKESQQSHGRYLLDFCDGQFFKHHPLFSENPHALQIIVYYDDVEVANPLGSYRGSHKLGNFLTCEYVM